MSGRGRQPGMGGAVALLVISAAVCAFLGVRLVSLHGREAQAQRRLSEVRGRAALSTLDSMTLPVNRPMAVCNDADRPLTVTAVAATYWDGEGKLQNFSSAAAQWHTWQVGGRESQKLALSGEPDSSWDGSAVFYAMDVSRDGRSALLAGTSDDLRDGCIHTANAFRGTP